MVLPAGKTEKQRSLHIFDHSNHPICIFNRDTGEIVERNKQFRAIFHDLEKSVDTLFWQSRNAYDRFIDQVQTTGSVTNYETSLESRDLLISASALASHEILLIILDVTEQKNYERKTRIQRDLGLALASCSSVGDALKLSLDAAMAVSEMDCGEAYLVEKETGEFVLIHHENLSEHFVRLICRSPHDAGEIRSYINSVAYEEGLRALALIPIRHNDQVIAALHLSSHTLEKIPDYVRDDLEIIASQIGNVISRIRAEDKVAKNKTNTRTFFDSIQDFIFVLDAEGRVLHINQAVIDRLGYTGGELTAMNIIDVYPPQRRDEARAIVAEMVAGKKNIYAVPFMRRDGEEIPVETTVIFSRWDGKDVFFSISRDLTERVRAHETLKRRNAILHAVCFAAHTFLQNERWDEGIDEVLKRLGDATGVGRVSIFKNHTGHDNTLLCIRRFEWCAPGVEPQILNPALWNFGYETAGYGRWIRVLEKGDVLAGDVDTFPAGERENLHSQGIRSLIIIPIISDARWWGFIRFDSCKEREAWYPEEIDALRVAAVVLGSAIHRTGMKEAFKQPVEQSLVGIYLIYNDTLEYVNPRFAEIFGYEVDDLVHKKNIPSLVFPEDRELFNEHFRQILSGEVQFVHFECRALAKNNRKIFVEAYGSIIEFKGRSAIVGNVMDITEQKLYEQDLSESRERYHQLFQSATDAIFIIREKQFVDCNPGALEMLGCSMEEAFACSPLDFTPEFQSDGRRSAEAMEEYYVRASRGENHRFEWRGQGKGGAQVDIEVTLNRFDLRSGAYHLAIARNITGKKQIEQLKAEAFARIEQNLEQNLEQFAILNDEIRNPLQVIYAIAEMNIGEGAEIVMQQVGHINRLVNDLDRGYIESDKVREFLRKHYEIGEKME